MFEKDLINPLHVLAPTERSPHRLEAFFDAIFAIAMTILVLSLALPQGQTPGSLPELIELIWSQFFHFALSFYILASFWRSHHRLFGAIKNLNETVIQLNFGILFVTCLLPFTTSIAGVTPRNIPSIALFHLNLFILGTLFWFHWRYAYKTGLLTMEPVQYKINVHRHVLVPVAAIIALFVVNIAPSYSYLAYLFVPIIQIGMKRRAIREYGANKTKKPDINSNIPPSTPDHTNKKSRDLYLTISPELQSTLEKSAEQTGMSREEFTIKILSFWERNRTMNLEGENQLCNLIPDSPEMGKKDR